MIKIKITKEIIKLIPFFLIKNDEEKNCITISNDLQFNLGSHLLEDMAFILGKIDKAIPNTQNDADGRAFDDNTEEELLTIYNYIKDNLIYIEQIIHQYSVKGGVTEGVYEANPKDYIWLKVNTI